MDQDAQLAATKVDRLETKSRELDGKQQQLSMRFEGLDDRIEAKANELIIEHGKDSKTREEALTEEARRSRGDIDLIIAEINKRPQWSPEGTDNLKREVIETCRRETEKELSEQEETLVEILRRFQGSLTDVNEKVLQTTAECQRVWSQTNDPPRWAEDLYQFDTWKENGNR